jgi:hypothetical protein
MGESNPAMLARSLPRQSPAQCILAARLLAFPCTPIDTKRYVLAVAVTIGVESCISRLANRPDYGSPIC